MRLFSETHGWFGTPAMQLIPDMVTRAAEGSEDTFARQQLVAGVLQELRVNLPLERSDRADWWGTSLWRACWACRSRQRMWVLAVSVWFAAACGVCVLGFPCLGVAWKPKFAASSWWCLSLVVSVVCELFALPVCGATHVTSPALARNLFSRFDMPPSQQTHVHSLLCHGNTRSCPPVRRPVT